MKLFLSGPMGVGKSTVGRVVAERLALPFIDLDERIESIASKPIAAIFAERGESGFRRLELEAFDALPDHTGFVCALGGGAVTQHPLRRAAQFEGRVVSLRAPAELIGARLSSEEQAKRPLLSGDDGIKRLEELMRERDSVYREAHDLVDVGRSTAEEVANELTSELTVQKVLVPLGARSYTVDIGAGVRARAKRFAGEASSCFLVTDSNVGRLWLDEMLEILRRAKSTVSSTTFLAGEAQKNSETVARLWDAGLASGLDRKGLVVALGGGVTGDLGGFVGATLFRGVDVLQLPTSVLAMVDSSVGGKTGFDHASGKNLIGSFHQPKSVLCDLDFLATLPEEERISGLAEVAKAAWLDSEQAVEQLEKDANALRAGEPEAMERAVKMAVALKARIVADDEREGGARRLLNLGHTVGHALEAAGGYHSLKHGEAVALGTVVAFRFSVGRGIATRDAEARSRSLLQNLGLPTSVHSCKQALAFLRQDKKRAGERLSFIFPANPGETAIEEIEISDLEHFLVNNFP